MQKEMSMLGKLMMQIATVREEILGTLVDLCGKLNGNDWKLWFDQLKRFCRQEPCWATTMFITSKKFVVDLSRKAEVKISYVGDNFQDWIAPVVGEAVFSFDPKSFVLDKNMLDGHILDKIGVIAKAIIWPSEMYFLMQKQPNGPKSPDGRLLTNGYANIFYTPQEVQKLEGTRFSYVDKNGQEVAEEVKDPRFLFELKGKWYVLRAVSVYWHGGGWSVFASSVENPDGWGAGNQVFFRN